MKKQKHVGARTRAALKRRPHPGVGHGPANRPPTGRERAVAQMVADGLSNEEIGKALSIATKTVEAHRASLYKRLQVKNTAQLIAMGIATGLITVKVPQVA
ncbi:MAG: LuxR C-terminal-related transcriptional regulator [Candidatus Krumholzibacteria bacterium]|nr:LuxR C-terminal-related transcriptional regulator [Candidatus Krumholzibacteria bacterium]